MVRTRGSVAGVRAGGSAAAASDVVSVLEVGFRIPDTPEELFELIGDPDEENQQPFAFVICGCGWIAPIGIYRLPRSVGETVSSSWPAEFRASEAIVVGG